MNNLTNVMGACSYGEALLNDDCSMEIIISRTLSTGDKLLKYKQNVLDPASTGAPRSIYIHNEP